MFQEKTGYDGQVMREKDDEKLELCLTLSLFTFKACFLFQGKLSCVMVFWRKQGKLSAFKRERHVFICDKVTSHKTAISAQNS